MALKEKQKRKERNKSKKLKEGKEKKKKSPLEKDKVCLALTWGGYSIQRHYRSIVFRRYQQHANRIVAMLSMGMVHKRQNPSGLTPTGFILFCCCIVQCSKCFYYLLG